MATDATSVEQTANWQDPARDINTDEILQHYAIRTLGEALADAAYRHDYQRFAALWMEDGLWEIGPPIDIAFKGRRNIRSGFEVMLGRWDFFVQMPHAFDVRIDGNRATATWAVHEVARTTDLAIGNNNYSLYLDDIVRTSAGWRFARRRYRTIYSDRAPLHGQSLHLTKDELRILYWAYRRDVMACHGVPR